MSYCVTCGTALREDALYCHECGHRRGDSAVTTKKTVIHLPHNLTQIFRNKKTVIICCAALLALTVLLFSLFGGKPSGTYIAQDGISYTFEGDTLTTTVMGIDVTGTYKIKGGTITLTYTMLGMSTSQDMTYKRIGGKIYINGLELTKIH